MISELLFLLDYNTIIIIIGCILISSNSSLVGNFLLLKKESLLGDVVSHSILSGIALSFILFENKNILILILGGFLTGWLSIFLTKFISNRTKIKKDSSLAINISIFFSIAILLFNYIQNNVNSNKSGLITFVFGKAAAMNINDIYILLILTPILILVTIIFIKSFKIICFDKNYAKTIGLPVSMIEFILSTITIISITISIQIVGSILIISLLIIPSATALYWTNKFNKMLILSILFSIISCFFGIYFSLSFESIPTGPCITISLSLICFLSIIIGNRNSLIKKILLKRDNEQKIMKENILKAFYKICEKNTDFSKSIRFEEIINHRSFDEKKVNKYLKKLEYKNLIINKDNAWILSKKGLEESKRIVRNHRLWEEYLVKKMNLDKKDVHPIAESIEHIITKKIKDKLYKELKNPKKDPHNKNIP